MKLRKAFALISLIVLVGCGHKKTSSSIVQEDSSSSSLVNDETTSSSLSSSKTSSSKISASYSSLSINIRSNSRTSSNQTVEHSVTFNFYNPSCGTFSTEVLNERLATYMNETAKADIVTSISNTKCQIAANIPTNKNSVLIIGAASQAGSLEFTFSETIKKVAITAQTYHKPYTDYQTGETVPNVDANSVCYINDGNTYIDLKPVNGQPVEKDFTTSANSKKLKLYTLEDQNSRVLVKSLTIVY